MVYFICLKIFIKKIYVSTTTSLLGGYGLALRIQRPAACTSSVRYIILLTIYISKAITLQQMWNWFLHWWTIHKVIANLPCERKNVYRQFLFSNISLPSNCTVKSILASLQRNLSLSCYFYPTKIQKSTGDGRKWHFYLNASLPTLRAQSCVRDSSSIFLNNKWAI